MGVLRELASRVARWRVVTLEDRRLLPEADEASTALRLDRNADRARLREATWRRTPRNWRTLGTTVALAVPVIALAALALLRFGSLHQHALYTWPLYLLSRDGRAAFTNSCFFQCGLLILVPLLGVALLHRLARQRPKGASARAAVGAGRAARVRAEGPVGSWLELRYGPEIILRIGWCDAHTLELDDGGSVRIPAGPWIVDGSRATPMEIVGADAEELLERLERRARRPRESALFPYDRAVLVTVGPGDRVEIAEPLERIGVAEAGATFREGAGIFRPEGVPRIRLLSQAEDEDRA
ncbi:MAG: hypothetical protein IT378_25680 [Sandaracinaceae bacterium]|nr:hypothetical protein [Sandaracinaceae bacterium]